MTVTLGAKAGMVAEPQSRRKRGSLSTGEIVMASIRVLDTEGPAALTFNRLGKELRSSPTAVYRHYASRQDLVVALAEHLDYLSLENYEPSDNWREDLTELAWRAWEVANKHPAAASVAMGLITNGANELNAVEAVLRAITQAGLHGRQAVIHYQVYANLVLGAAMAQGSRLSEGLYEKADDHYQVYSPSDPAKWPITEGLKDDLRVVDYVEVFRRQVEMYLDALGLAVARQHRNEPVSDAD
jgi:AcrR family transcriptional regulator